MVSINNLIKVLQQASSKKVRVREQSAADRAGGAADMPPVVTSKFYIYKFYFLSYYSD